MKMLRLAGTQPILAGALVAVGIGNIVIPHGIPIISSWYLLGSLFVIIITVVFRIGTLLHNLHFPFVVSGFGLAFAAGFLVAPLNAYGMTKLWALVIIMVLIAAPAAFERIDRSFPIIAAALFMVSAVSAIVVLAVGDVDIAGRRMLPGINPIGSGRVSALAIVIGVMAFVLWDSRLGAKRWILVAAAVPCSSAVVATGSRGPFVAAVASIFVALFVFMLAKKRRWPILLAALAVGTIAVLGARELASLDSRASLADASGRWVLYQAAWGLVQQNPLGIGWGNFYAAVPNFTRAGEERLYAHNIILEVGVEGGWIALLMLLALLAVAVLNLTRAVLRGHRQATMLLALLLFALTNAFVSSDIVGNRLLWLMIGLSLLRFDVESQANAAPKTDASTLTVSDDLSARRARVSRPVRGRVG